MIFDEVVSILNNRKNEDRFVAYDYDPQKRIVSFYEVFYDAGEDGNPPNPGIFVLYGGGKLFDESGEEDQFDLGDLPERVRSLVFNPGESVGHGMTADYVVDKLFPELPQSELWGFPDGKWGKNHYEYAKKVEGFFRANNWI